MKGSDTIETPLDHWSSADFMGEEEEEEAVSTVCEKSARVYGVLVGGGRGGGGGLEMPSSSLLIRYQAHNYRATKQAINQPGFNDVQS